MPNARDKGKNAERELCRLLSEIFSGSFVRVPHSGSIVGGKNVHRRQTLSKTQDRSFRGDIIPPDHLPRLIIESKAYKGFRFHQLLQPGACPLLDEWIKQTLDVVDAGDAWFICFKVNLLGWYIAMPDQDGSDYIFENCCIYNSSHGRFRVTDLLSFFRTNAASISRRAGGLAAENEIDERIQTHRSANHQQKHRSKHHEISGGEARI